MEEMRLMFFELDTRYCGFHVFGETCTIFYESVLLKFSNCCDIAFISVKLHNRDCIYISGILQLCRYNNGITTSRSHQFN